MNVFFFFFFFTAWLRPLFLKQAFLNYCIRLLLVSSQVGRHTLAGTRQFPRIQLYNIYKYQVNANCKKSTPAHWTIFTKRMRQRWIYVSSDLSSFMFYRLELWWGWGVGMSVFCNLRLRSFLSSYKYLWLRWEGTRMISLVSKNEITKCFCDYVIVLKIHPVLRVVLTLKIILVAVGESQNCLTVRCSRPQITVQRPIFGIIPSTARITSKFRGSYLTSGTTCAARGQKFKAKIGIFWHRNLNDIFVCVQLWNPGNNVEEIQFC